MARLHSRNLLMITATALGLGIGWVLPAQQATGPQWKDRAEFDIYTEYTQAKDSKGRLATLEKWSKGYADSELWELRDNFYLGVYGDMKNFRGAFDRAKQMRAKKPEAYFAIVTVLNSLAQLNPRTDADYATATDVADYVLSNEAKVFAPSNKPEQYKDDQWAKEKPAVQQASRQIKIYVLSQQKKTAELEALLAQYLKDDPTQAAFNFELARTLYSQRAQDQSKWIPAIFHFTRAGVYTGPNALSAANAKIASDSSKSAYKAFHGSMNDYEKTVEVAKNNGLPPAGFTIESVIDLSKKDAASKDAWDKVHPELVFWRQSIQIPLSVPNAASVFDSNYKDAGFPPEGLPFATFTANIVSMTPEQNPKEMIVELFDPADPNDVRATLSARLLFEPPLQGTMETGKEIKFKGIAKEFQASPFQVTFEIDPENQGKIEGWTGAPPAPAKQTKRGTKAGAKSSSKSTRNKGK